MYLAGGLTSYFKILQWLLLTGTTFSICSNSSDSDLKWIVPATHPNNGNLMLLVGEWWEIDCRVNDDKVNVTLWQREIWRAPFENQRDADGENINMKDKNVFRLAKLKLSDQGRYFCKACGMKKYAGGIYVNQGVPFATPSITKTPNTDLLPYGSAVTLKCNVEGSYADYEIKWFKIISFREKKFLLSQDSSSVREDKPKHVQREVLKIYKLTEKDNGSYLCQVRRFAVDHIANNSVDIIVEGCVPNWIVPESHESSKMLTRLVGESWEINCRVKSDNVNAILWQEDILGRFEPGERHVDGEHIKLKDKNVFLITKLNVSDEGKYYCKACEKKKLAGKIFVNQDDRRKSSSRNNRTILLTSIIPVGSVTVATIFFLTYMLYKRKTLYGGFYIFSYPPLPDYIDKLDVDKDIHEQLEKLPYIAEWEFPRERITLRSEIGMGEFGCVWLAEAMGISGFRPRDILKQRSNRRRLSMFLRSFRRNNYVYCKEVTTIAVKKLKENWDRSKLGDLRSELKVLIHVGEHENIVNLLGACTKGKCSDLWIIMEYCPHGNLRTFLRNSRDTYDFKERSLTPDPSQALGPRNLVLFALHIAKGMEFLISRKVIHRDLAARNILLGHEYVAKVADFGLARDVYKYETYVKRSTGLVPLKWMALESIKDSVFTEKTDVWSFGVLLWELFTLGGTPYPGIQAIDMYKYLLNGKRMGLPMHCPPVISQMITDCWYGNPNNRPNFKMLVKILGESMASTGNLETTSNNNKDEVSDFEQIGESFEEDNISPNKGYIPVIFEEDSETIL